MTIRNAALALLCAACASTPTPREHESGVTSRARLAMMRYEMHGMSGSILIADSGRALEQGYGLADRERRVRASALTQYDVASITKTFTAAAILRLVADGKIDTRASIAKYFENVAADKAAITVHHILTHTAGFALDPSNAGVASADPPSVYVAKALKAPLLHLPGAAYAYSNLGYGLLAILIERVSGEDFRSFVTRTLIGPAGLRHTRWWGDSVALSGARMARGYEFSDREYVLTPEPPFARGAANSPMWSKWPLGAAGILTTVGDQTDWLKTLTQSRLLPDSLTRRMFESQTTGTVGQSYGWNVGTHPVLGERIHRGGGRTGFTSMLAYYPRRQASIAFALNQNAEANWQTVVWRSLERALAGMSDTLPPATIALAPAALGSLAGQYAVSQDARVRITIEDGTLVVGGEGQLAANVLVERRDLDSVITRTATESALPLIREALSGAVGETTRALVSDHAAIGPWLRTRAAGIRAEQVSVLGTVPHPAGEGIVHTFIRLGTTNNAPVVRLIWERDKVAAWGDGIRLPGFGRFRPTTRDAAVAYHPVEIGWRTIEFQRNDRGDVVGIVVVLPNGARSETLSRVR